MSSRTESPGAEAPAGPMTSAQRLVAIGRFLVRRRGDRRWDLFLRSAGALAALGIPIVIAFPESVPLVWLAVLALPANSPLSPIFPAAFEPVIMEAAKYAAVLPVTVVALTAYLYMEFLNWHVYRWTLNRRILKGFRGKGWVGRSIEWFQAAPFWSVVIFAFTPLPFWAVRVVAILGAYSLTRFMIATAVGRFPRILFYAWLGAAFKVPTWVLAAVIFGSAAVLIGFKLARREPLLTDPGLDGAPAEDPR
ncbi:MAG TPA: VTT domain-containing protein [Gemmatimonadales bacterium]|nr:VTT domain-containing protein [Gemmatimonadales bacterium]